MGEQLTDQIFAALDEQTLSYREPQRQRRCCHDWPTSCWACPTNANKSPLKSRKQSMLTLFPGPETSMPGVGVRTAARILITVGDASSFPTAGHLAAYAGLAPVTRRSGSSIRGESPSRSGNKELKNTLFLSAFAALRDPASRAYYDRKRAEGKKRNAAIICLARRRTDVLYAMLRENQPYLPKRVKRLDERHRDTPHWPV